MRAAEERAATMLEEMANLLPGRWTTNWEAARELIVAALEAYHLARLRAGLGEPPVSEEQESMIRERAVQVRPLAKESTWRGTLARDLATLLAALDYYRDLAAAIALDSGAAEAYERGRREGLIEGKRRCVEVAQRILDAPPGDGGWPSVVVRAVECVSVKL